MKLPSWLPVALILGGLFLAFSGGASKPADVKPAPGPVVPNPAPSPVPAPPEPAPKPCPGPGPCPNKPKPWGPRSSGPVGSVVVGGPEMNGVEVQADLPVSLRKKNIGGTDGAGLCVFTSIMHSARFQNERSLFQFQEQMSHERGGGYPEKVDAMLAKYAPSVQYIQYTGKDPSVIRQALASGRMPAVTWNGYQDPHYSGHRIAHMVNCVCYTDTAVAILDNNFIGDDQLVWMTPDDFQHGWTGGGSGWVVVLLAPSPVPMPSK